MASDQLVSFVVLLCRFSQCCAILQPRGLATARYCIKRLDLLLCLMPSPFLMTREWIKSWNWHTSSSFTGQRYEIAFDAYYCTLASVASPGSIANLT